MTIPEKEIYPRTGDKQTIYLKSVITDPGITVGEYTMYNDFVNDPVLFEKNNVLYHYPINRDKLIIGKFCSIACGAKFLFNSANHTLRSLSTYPFPLFFEEWGLDKKNVTDSWDNKGDIVIGSDVWIGYEAVIMAGVHWGRSHHRNPCGGDKRCFALYNCRRDTCEAYKKALFRRNHIGTACIKMVGLAERKDRTEDRSDSVRLCRAAS